MKKLFCICILTCLLLTSCGGGGEDLNVYTTEPRTETNALQPSIGAADTTAENIAVKTPDIPEELREYVVNYTYEFSKDSNECVLQRSSVPLVAAVGNYLYYVDMSSVKNPIIKQLNLVTGEIAVPCFDPVCTHNSIECDFFFERVSNILAFGKYVVFYAAKDISSTGQNRGYLYDTSTGILYKEIFNKQGNTIGSVYISCIDDNLYNSVTVQKDNPNATGSTDKTIYEIQMCRYNISTNTSSVIHSIVGTQRNGGLSVAYNGRIYYSEGSMYYSMLPDTSDVREEPYFAENTAFFTEELRWINTSSAKNSIRSINMRTGEAKEVVAYNGYDLSYFVTNNYLYFYYKILSKDQVGNECTVYELWRCNHNGGNKTKLCSLNMSPGNFFVYGNYIYTHCKSEGNDNGAYKLARIHVETGEVLYIE